MFKAIALCTLFAIPTAFASSLRDSRKDSKCREARTAMAKTEEKFMPGDRAFCLEDEDCAFLSLAPWKIAIGINKISLARYHRMKSDPGYKALSKEAARHCSHNHPHIIVKLPRTANCYDNSCVPVWD